VRLLDIVRRVNAPPAAWQKIPWDDPAFSARMLAEHLSQAHDAASRRLPLIDEHVAWIHSGLLGGRPSRVLDLGCGPGLYANRLAQRGHTVTGIDFAPATVQYARRRAAEMHWPAVYMQADMRAADYGRGYDLVMLIFGEFNAFTRADAAAIVTKAHAALNAGGALLLEVSTFDSIRLRSERAASWSATERGLYSDGPYINLRECAWDAAQAVATERYYIIDTATTQVTPYAQMTQAYHEAEYREALAVGGFTAVERLDAFGAAASPDMYLLVARTTNRADAA